MSWFTKFFNCPSQDESDVSIKKSDVAIKKSVLNGNNYIPPPPPLPLQEKVLIYEEGKSVITKTVRKLGHELETSNFVTFYVNVYYDTALQEFEIMLTELKKINDVNKIALVFYEPNSEIILRLFQELNYLRNVVIIIAGSKFLVEDFPHDM